MVNFYRQHIGNTKVQNSATRIPIGDRIRIEIGIGQDQLAQYYWISDFYEMSWRYWLKIILEVLETGWFSTMTG